MAIVSPVTGQVLLAGLLLVKNSIYSIFRKMHIDQVRLFSALSNEIRLRCLNLLAVNGEVCVCEFVDALEITQPTASKALKGLKEAGLISDRRDANWIHYRLRDDLPDWLDAIVQASLSQLAVCKTCRADLRRFKRLAAKAGEAACS